MFIVTSYNKGDDYEDRVFLLGVTENEETAEEIRREAEESGDYFGTWITEVDLDQKCKVQINRSEERLR